MRLCYNQVPGEKIDLMPILIYLNSITDKFVVYGYSSPSSSLMQQADGNTCIRQTGTDLWMQQHVLVHT